MINIQTKKGKRQQQRELVLMMMQIEKSWSRSLNPIIKKFYIDSANSVERGFTGRIEWEVDKYIPDLRKLFKKYYKIIGVTFFRKLFKDFKKSGLGYQKKAVDDWFDELDEIEMGPIEERYWKVYGEWSSKQMGKKIQKVTGTAKKKINRIISSMMEEGTSHKEIAKLISEKSSLSRWESERITRTETHGAAVFSTQSSIESTGKETGIVFNKYWISALDDRTRQTHIDAGNKYNESNAIPMDEKYRVGDAELLFPGDPDSVAPEETINCRCVELYVPAEAGQNPS